MSDTPIIEDSFDDRLARVVRDMLHVMPEGGFAVTRIVRRGGECVEAKIAVSLRRGEAGRSARDAGAKGEAAA